MSRAMRPLLAVGQPCCSSAAVSRRAAAESRSYSASARLTDHPSSSASLAPARHPQQARRRYGQPLPHTHPHLFPHRLSLEAGADLAPFDPHGNIQVAHDELTPGIPASEYEDRRRRLMDRLPERSVVVCMAGRVKSMSGNIFYRFRQDSNFLYLTGFQEPDAAVVLEKDSSSRGYKMTMFVQDRDEANETWNGPRSGIDGATDVFGADEAFAMDPSSFLNHLKDVLPRSNHIYVEPSPTPTVPRMSSRASKMPSILNFLSPPSPTPYDMLPKKADFEAVVKLLGDPVKSQRLSPTLDKLRLRKSTNELRLMRRAGRIGSEAMIQTMEFVRPGMVESALQSRFEASCSLAGAQRPAYVPVVASGSNALTIHYVNNDDVCRAGDMVCMDAGCELDGYVSDITRAFPVNSDGKFSGPQADLYEAVLRVLRSCTALVSQSQAYTLAELHRRSVEMLAAELRALGFDLRPGVLEREIYPHALSHWLGMDLHDTPSVERTTRLEEGMCLSVEPAVYCSEHTSGVPKAFWGMGIRIEDDVAVGQQGNIVLNAECPRERVDVEAACSRFLEGVKLESTSDRRRDAPMFIT